MVIKRKIKDYYTNIVINLFSNDSKKQIFTRWCINDSIELGIMLKFVAQNRNVTYTVQFEDIPSLKASHKWVGAQCINDQIICIPSDETRILINDGKWRVRENLKDGLFKWTGGCVWENSIYCFPRTSNSFLKINNDNVEEIPLEYTYNVEHHYSGVCTEDGIVYQPPRNTSHILKTDLKTGQSTKISIINDKYHVKLSYCGSIMHPNGYIYFFPVQNNKVIKLDPTTDRWDYIGHRITTLCFDAKVGLDGNIYGFNNNEGITKIDVFNDTVSIIHQEINSGSYGTKYGVDGCLYNIPGDGTHIYKFDVLNDEIYEIFDLNSDIKAKYAGGVVKRDGTILGVPANEHKMMSYKPSKRVLIPEDIYNLFYVDNY